MERKESEQEVLEGYLQRERRENRQAQDVFGITKIYSVISDDTMRNMHIVNEQLKGELEMSKIEQARTNKNDAGQKVTEDVQREIQAELRIPEASYNVDLNKMHKEVFKDVTIYINSRFVNVYVGEEKTFKFCYNSIECHENVDTRGTMFDECRLQYNYKQKQFAILYKDTPVICGTGWVWTLNRSYEKLVTQFSL